MHIILDRDELNKINKKLEHIVNFLNKSTELEELISLESAEKLTEMEYQKLRQMFLDGKLKGKRFGRAIRLSKTHLLECKKEV